MNLHGMVVGLIGAVNPQIPIIIRSSVGRTVSPDGTPIPQYASPVTILGQVQELSIKDLHQVEGLNLNGTVRSLYISGQLVGGQRVTLKGGDVIVLPGDETIWLVVGIPEAWPDWSRALIVQQNDSASIALLAALQAQTY